jgi:hypothetical protein
VESVHPTLRTIKAPHCLSFSPSNHLFCFPLASSSPPLGALPLPSFPHKKFPTLSNSSQRMVSNSSNISLKRLSVARLHVDGPGPREFTDQALARRDATDDTAGRRALEDVLAVPRDQVAVVDDVFLAFDELEEKRKVSFSPRPKNFADSKRGEKGREREAVENSLPSSTTRQTC